MTAVNRHRPISWVTNDSLASGKAIRLGKAVDSCPVEHVLVKRDAETPSRWDESRTRQLS